MIVFKRRLLFWLFKAYIKKWGKFIALSFLAGLAIFFLLLQFGNTLLRLVHFERRTIVGIAGAYNLDHLPMSVEEKLSRGLTHVTPDGLIVPDAAQSWQVRDNGKTYVFYLKNNIAFSDGKKFTSDLVNYDFANVTVERPNASTIVFKLKDEYSPFLTTVSRPIFQKGYIGIGEYKIRQVELNGNFIKSMQLVGVADKKKVETYKFYSTPEALKVAFALGEVSHAIGLGDDAFKNTSFSTYPQVTVSKVPNYRQLVTLFYNTTDPLLSDKRLRNALTYALPDSFAGGERAYLPYPPTSHYFNADLLPRSQDYSHSLLLMDAVVKANNGKHLSVTIKTLERHKDHAKVIAEAWKKIGVTAKIEEVSKTPIDYQIFLGDFTLPHDPDQYTLWHSDQGNNITRFKNLRIDKLLEDGRTKTNVEERQKLYADFQKYLLDESPAAFLFFPYEYDITRL